MRQTLSAQRLALALIGAATVLVVAYAGISSAARAPNGALVAVRKTTLGQVLVDARGRTLYLFEKDGNSKSACNSTCTTYWPPLVSSATPRAGTGVHNRLLGVTRRPDGRRQVTYAGHPLYTFVGDKRAGQTSGEGLKNFGAEWYAIATSGRTVEQSDSSSGDAASSGGGYGSGSGW